MTVMREFESVIGWLRLCIIYFVSGIGGYLASAIFVPYMVEFLTSFFKIPHLFLARSWTGRLTRRRARSVDCECFVQLELFAEPKKGVGSAFGNSGVLVSYRISTLYRQLGTTFWVFIWMFVGGR